MNGPSTEPQRFEVLVSDYGSARYEVADAIHQSKDYRPAYDRGMQLFREITDRVGKVRKLALEELARDSDRAVGLSAAEVLRLLDGAPPAEEVGLCESPWNHDLCDHD